MKAIVLLALVAVVAVSAQTSSGPAQTPTTICEQITAAKGLDFSVATNEYNTMKAFLVSAATGKPGTGGFAGLFANTITKPYFDGTLNYRRYGPVTSPFFATRGDAPNFGTNIPEQNQLVDHLTRFFGDALGCKATGWSAYVSSVNGVAFNQYQVHRNMNITQTVFSAFNGQVAAAATAYGGFDADDLAAVTAYLNSFGRNNVDKSNEICVDATCLCAPGIVPADTCDQTASASLAQASFVTLALVALVALFSVRL